MIAYSNKEANFAHKLLLTDRQVSKLYKIFSSNSSASIKLSKTKYFKVIESVGLEGFLNR